MSLTSIFKLHVKKCKVKTKPYSIQMIIKIQS